MRNKKEHYLRLGIGLLVLVFLTAAVTWRVAIHSFTGDKYLLTKEQFTRFTQYQKLDELIASINKNYYQDVKESDLITGAYKGLVQGIGDPYSEYLTQEDIEELKTLETGKYYGVGITYSINKDYDYPQVKGVISGSPAEGAGVKIGDLITAVDGTDIRGYATDKLYSLIAGEKGKQVELTINRDGEAHKFTMNRAELEEEVIESRVINGHIGYVRLTQFNGGSAKKVQDAFTKLQKQGCNQFIFDLRNNGGGLLSEAVKIADFFMPQGRIVYTKTKEGVEDVYDSDASSFGKPVILLVNGYSASASEVVAGAMQNAKVAKLVGTKTFGKGIVQTTHPLTDGKSSIKLTTSVYYLANNQSPQGQGITPDETVDMEVKDTFDQEHDAQLEKAIELCG